MISFKFPEKFLFGAGSSAYQFEGSPYADGKSENIWDYACRVFPEKFKDNSKTEPGAGFYTHFEQDIAEMKAQGLTAFRFSLSWARILPTIDGGVNPKGIDFYNRVIDLLLENGIEPFVDIYHWDLPMYICDIGGFKNRSIIDHFVRFARVCFESFGDRVKLWSTMNEPSVFCFSPYANKRWPPYEGEFSNAILATYHTLLCHYRTVRLYREMGLDGKIGVVHAVTPFYPKDPTSEKDRLAASIAQDVSSAGWWIQPMMEGTYSEIVLENCPAYKNALPEGFAEEMAREFVPMDFVGLNYYHPSCVYYSEKQATKFAYVENYYMKEGQKFAYYPAGLYDIMMYITERFNRPEIYITENGLGLLDSGNKEEMLNDDIRVEYLREHLRMASRCVKAGADIRGYFYWSIFDSFENAAGYSYRFGLTYIDQETLERTHKKSWYYYSSVVTNKTVD